MTKVTKSVKMIFIDDLSCLIVYRYTNLALKKQTIAAREIAQRVEDIAQEAGGEQRGGRSNRRRGPMP